MLNYKHFGDLGPPKNSKSLSNTRNCNVFVDLGPPENSKSLQTQRIIMEIQILYI